MNVSSPGFLHSQQDPFHWTEPISVESNDIFLQWLAPDGESYQKIYHYRIDSSNSLPHDSLVSETPRHSDGRQFGGSYTDAASGRFNTDPYDDIVSIGKVNILSTPEGDGGYTGINIMLPQLDTTEAMWNTVVQDSIVTNPQDRIYVKTLDTDGDSLDEFIVAYVDTADSVHFNLYDVNSSLEPTLLSSFSDTKLVNAYGFQFIRYVIETGDFNGDGTDELMLVAAVVPPPSGSVRLNVQTYDFESNQFIAKGDTVIDVPRLSTLEDFNMSITAGQFTSDSKDEIALATIRSSETQYFMYSYLLDVSENLQTITIGPRHRITPDASVDLYTQLDGAAGDLNNDGRDEMVLSNGMRIYVLTGDDNLTLTDKVTTPAASGGPDDYTQSYNFLKVRDVNQDSREDIIIVRHFVDNQFADGFFVAMITVSEELDEAHSIGRLFGDEPQFGNYLPYTIAVGNFDGYDFTIGQPAHSIRSNIVQPIVVLNAPPIHFDKFGEDIFDINSCYNGGDCDFIATYTKTTTTSVEVSTKVHSDWGISAGISASGSVSAEPMGVGVSTNYQFHLLGKYGKEFSRDSTNVSTVSISVAVDAEEDDQIYTTITDYDVWEYPVYHGNETSPRRVFLTLVPRSTRGRWFPSKSWSALDYISDHEVGNILSYQAYDTLDHNPNVAQTVRTNYGDDSFVLGSNTSYDWSLTMTDFQSSQADTSREIGVDLGANFPPYAYNFDYTNTKMSTHKVSVTDEINIDVHLGSINQSFGETRYTVTPYAYWGTSGALIVDYAANPELAAPNFPPTWWQEKYENASDPAFILPWRLDPEKGFGISEEAKRFQTNDIYFTPKNPSPGDTLTITTQVRNFSLESTPQPVSVKFYIGDPDSGGTPLIGVNGTNTVTTDGPISARKKTQVSLQWILPNNLPSYPRIYAILDEEDNIPEIHSTNNKGFNVLGQPAVPTNLEEEPVAVPDNVVLYQSYPNPFNPSATIRYSLSKQSPVNLTIYDLQGRVVKILVNDLQIAGVYQKSWKGRNDAGEIVSSGVYFYRLQAGEFVNVKKMVFVK